MAQRGVFKCGRYWSISYTLNGKVVRRSTKQSNYRVACDTLNRIKADIAQGAYKVDREPAPLFEEYADYWFEYCSRPNKRSWARDETSIKFLKKAFSGMRLDEIGREHINKYKVNRLKQKSILGRTPARATINRELACMKTMLNMAIEEGKVDRNPVSGRGVMFKEDNKIERILSRTEEARLHEECINNLRRHIYWIIYTALQTGMRKGELLSRKWKNVDLENHRIKVTAENAKNGKIRVVPVNKNLTALLKEVKKETFDRGEYLFTGARRLKSIRYSWNKAKKLAGLKPEFRFHDLRHTVASRLVTELNVDVVTAAQILGHSDLKMLERYAHTRKDIEMQALEHLGDSGIAPQLHKNCTIDVKTELSGNNDKRNSL